MNIFTNILPNKFPKGLIATKDTHGNFLVDLDLSFAVSQSINDMRIHLISGDKILIDTVNVDFPEYKSYVMNLKEYQKRLFAS